MKGDVINSRFVVGVLGALGSLICWGIVPVMLRALKDDVDPSIQNAIRYPLAAILYWPILYVTVRSGRWPKGLLRRAITPGVTAFGGQVLWALTFYLLPSSVGGFLIRTSFLFGAVAAMFVFADERALLRRPTFSIGAILAIAGCAGLTLSKISTDQAVTAAGIAAVLGSALFFGLYAVSIRYYLSDVNPLVSFGVVSQYVSAGMLTVAAFMPQKVMALAELPAKPWILLIVSSVLGIAMGHVLFYIAVARLGATVSGGVHLVSPFVTFSIASWALGETLSTRELVAGVIIVAGAALLLSSQASLGRVRASPLPSASNIPVTR